MPTSPSTDLTIDSLGEAVKHFLRQIAESDDPVDQHGLVLWGTPGDDAMRVLMELFDGTIRITVNTLPAGMPQSLKHPVAYPCFVGSDEREVIDG